MAGAKLPMDGCVAAEVRCVASLACLSSDQVIRVPELKLQWAKLITLTVIDTTAVGNPVDEGMTVLM